MAVLDPVKLIIDNYPEGSDGDIEHRRTIWRIRSLASRKVPFGRELYIEQRGLHGESAEEVFPPFPGQRSPSHGRILRDMHRLTRRTRTEM